jgi:hypothetical protein
VISWFALLFMLRRGLRVREGDVGLDPQMSRFGVVFLNLVSFSLHSISIKNLGVTLSRRNWVRWNMGRGEGGRMSYSYSLSAFRSDEKQEICVEETDDSSVVQESRPLQSLCHFRTSELDNLVLAGLNAIYISCELIGVNRKCPTNSEDWRSMVVFSVSGMLL